MEAGGAGEGGGERAASLFTSSSFRPQRPPRAPTPEPLPPLPTKLRILRGSRGVNKTLWSLPPPPQEEEKQEKREGEEGKGEGTEGEEEERKESSCPRPLVLFFGGDEVAATDSHSDVVRLQTPQAQAAACACRYSNSKREAAEPQVVILVPSRHEAGWACFDHFFAPNGLTRSGEPAPPGYRPGALPALSQAASLLREGGWPFAGGGKGGVLESDGSTLDLDELKKMKNDLSSSLASSASASSSSPWPPTKIVAFSKGGVVANQVLFELSALGRAGFRRRRRRKRSREEGAESRENAAVAEKLLLQALAEEESNSNNGVFSMLPPAHARPQSQSQQGQRPELLARSLAAPLASLAESIDEVVYLDAGLNCRGAYAVTDPGVARGLALLDSGGEEGEDGEEGKLKVKLLGTPRQWGGSSGGDRSRSWLVEEKDRMFKCLREASVAVSSEMVLEGRKPDLRTHFLGIEAFGRG